MLAYVAPAAILHNNLRCNGARSCAVAVVKKWSAPQKKNVRLLAYVQDIYYICDSNNKQKQRHMKSLLIVIAAIIVTIMIFGIALFFCEVLKALIKAIMEEEEYSEFKSTISKGEL